MPNIKSAWKRMRSNEKSRLRNKSRKSELKTVERKLRDAVESGDSAAATQMLSQAFARLDKAAKTGVIKKNKRDRKKSQLASLVAKKSAAAAPATA